ncbi:MAG: IS481-like element ISTvo3 family transposase [Thermoplasmataceae archaeon]
MLSTDDKRFIIQSVENGYKVSDLARMFNVTPRRVQQILKEDIDEEHTKKRYSSLTEQDVTEIENLWNNYKVGSRTIFYLLKSRGRSISYYQIYNYMRGKKMIRSKYSKEGEISKSEVEPPLTTVFMDYHQTGMDYPYAVVCVDMSTKKILSMVETRKITKEVMEKNIDALAEFRKSSSLDIQKVYLRSGILSILYGATDVKFYFSKKGVENVESDKHGNRVHLALSRLWQNYDRFRWTFNSPENFIYWYNNRPIISKSQNRVTTPNEIMEQYLEEQNLFSSQGKNLPKIS